MECRKASSADPAVVAYAVGAPAADRHPGFRHQAGKGTIYLFEPRGGKSAALNASLTTAQGQILAFADDDVADGIAEAA